MFAKRGFFNKLLSFSSLPDIQFVKSKCDSEQYQIFKYDLSHIKNETKVNKITKLKKKIKKLKRLNSTCSYESADSLESVELINLSLKSNSIKLIEEDENSSRSSEPTLSETDMGNAAQLPKGIENIRRHLENEIDNVPLHVSLFTDSTKQAIPEMIKIMKDYGEIVGCFGSSYSIENNAIFSVSNIAIGVEPLYPKLCVNTQNIPKTPNECNNDEQIKNPPNKPSLNELNVYMNTLSCGLNLKHENICILPPLLSLAREIIHSYRIALIFMLMCNLTVSLAQFTCNVLFLPPILSGFQVLKLQNFIF